MYARTLPALVSTRFYGFSPVEPERESGTGSRSMKKRIFIIASRSEEETGREDRIPNRFAPVRLRAACRVGMSGLFISAGKRIACLRRGRICPGDSGRRDFILS